MGTKSMPHVITGEPQMVAAALDRARADGRLLSITDARRLPGERVQLVAHLRAQAPERSGWERVRPWLIRLAKLAAVLAVSGAVAGLVWVLVLLVLDLIALVTFVIAWVHAHLALIVVGAVLLVLLLLGAVSSGGGCAGLHCGGCRR